MMMYGGWGAYPGQDGEQAAGKTAVKAATKAIR